LRAGRAFQHQVLQAGGPVARFPTPVKTKPDPMPTQERLRPDDCENLQD
jgi:hypothetical protein